MTYLKGGYILVNKNDSNIYESVSNALTLGKPILWYEDANTCYYIDTISKSGDDIVLTKGGKTISITPSNVINEDGEIVKHLHLMTVNSGNYRATFIVKKPLNEYEIASVTSLTDDDKEYLKSLKDIVINNIGCLYGVDGSEDTNVKYCGIYDNILNIALDSYTYLLNLDTPQNASEGDSLSFTFTSI